MADVYGTQFADDALDKLTTKLEALKALGGTTPMFNNVYDGHNIAKLVPIAATVELNGAESEVVGWTNDSLVQWTMEFSIRVITDFVGGETDAIKVMRIENSICNYLKENIDLGTDWRIKGVDIVSAGTGFPDNETYGGEILVIVAKEIVYTQV